MTSKLYLIRRAIPIKNRSRTSVSIKDANSYREDEKQKKVTEEDSNCK